MMDAFNMYLEGYHPVETRRVRKGDFTKMAPCDSRTLRAPKYYLIDFGLSRRYDPNNTAPLELPILGADRTVPEYQGKGYSTA